MPNVTEIILKFKIAQLEGKLAVYESLVTDISNLESMEAAAFKIKAKLENVLKVWHMHTLKENHGL